MTGVLIRRHRGEKGNSLMVQGGHASTAGSQVPSLVGELKSCIPRGVAKKKKEIVTPGRLIHREKAVSYEDTGEGSHLQIGTSDLRRNLPIP